MNPKQILERASRRTSRLEVLNQLIVFGKLNPNYKKKVTLYKKLLRSNSFGSSSFRDLDMESQTVQGFLKKEPSLPKTKPTQRTETDEFTEEWRMEANPYIQDAMKKRTPRELLSLEAHNEFWEKKYTEWKKDNPYPKQWPWEYWWKPKETQSPDKLFVGVETRKAAADVAEKQIMDDFSNFTL